MSSQNSATYIGGLIYILFVLICRLNFFWSYQKSNFSIGFFSAWQNSMLHCLLLSSTSSPQSNFRQFFPAPTEIALRWCCAKRKAPQLFHHYTYGGSLQYVTSLMSSFHLLAFDMLAVNAKLHFTDQGTIILFYLTAMRPITR